MRRPLVAIWSVACLLITTAPGCGSVADERAAVEIDRVTAPSPALEASLQAELSAALADSPAFTGGSGRLGGALRMAAWISASDLGGPPRLPGEASPSALFVHVELEVPADLRSQFDVAAISARAAVPGTDPSPAELRTAARTALEVLSQRLALARGDSAAAVALLGSADPELVLMALEWTRDHPNPTLADAVAAQVEHADPQVVLLALEVLANIGEARHAPVVVRRVERAPGLAREGYRTLAVLGGADAVGFLRFAAANEDDPELRREAERALATALADTGERVALRSHGVDLPRVVRGHRQ